MIIWKGWGLIGLLPLIVSCFIFYMGIAAGITKRGDGPESGAWIMLVAFVFWYLGRRANRLAKTFAEARHSLYGIPLQYYGIAMLLAGAFLTVKSALAPP